MALYRSLLARFAQNLTILKSSITPPDYSGVVLIIPIICSPSRKGKSHFIHIINKSYEKEVSEVSSNKDTFQTNINEKNKLNKK